MTANLTRFLGALRDWVYSNPAFAWGILALLGFIAGGLFVYADVPQALCFFTGGFTFICGSNALDEWEGA